MEAVGLSSGAAGIISLGITVTQGLLEYYRSWKHAEEHVTKMYSSMEALTKIFGLLESTLDHKRFPSDVLLSVEESIASAKAGVQSLERKLKKVQGTPLPEKWREAVRIQYLRALFPFKESTLAKLRELCMELRDNLGFALNVLQIDGSAAALGKLDNLGQQVSTISTHLGSLKEESSLISKNVHDINDTVSAAAEDIYSLALAASSNDYGRILDWLSPLTVDFENKHLETFNIRGRQDGMGRWLTETSEFSRWLESPGETLWCPGKPGAGKTVLVSYIINHLQSIVGLKGARLGYIYLNYKEKEKQTPINLIRSLARQLVAGEPTFLRELKALYEAHRNQRTALSLGECTLLIKAVIRRCPRVFIVVDAIDEISEESRRILMAELQGLQPRASILITSRYLPNIELHLEMAARLDFEARNEDILGYLEGCIADSPQIISFTKKDPYLPKQITETILTKAEGMFLCARLHIDALRTKTTLRKLKDSLNALPESLENTYEEALDRIANQPADQAALANKALCWVFHAMRPLSMVELQHLLSVEIGDLTFDEDGIPDEDLVLSACNGLIVHQQEHGSVGLVHYTLQEYFERKASALFPEAQRSLLRVCVTHLLFQEFNSGPCPNDLDYRARLQQRPLLQYAATCWGYHAQGELAEVDKQLILCFLRHRANMTGSVQILHASDQINLPGISQRFPRGVTPLWLAASHGVSSIVRHLLTEGADVSARTSFGDTALHRAVSFGQDEVVALLLDNGADHSAIDEFGNRPLHYTALQVSNLQSSSEREKEYPFLNAVHWTRIHAVSLLLLARGADVNAVNVAGKTALHLLIHYGYISLSRLLLENGADTTIRDRDGYSPLTIVASNGLEAFVVLLLQYDLQLQIECRILDDALRGAAHNRRHGSFKIILDRLPVHRPRPSDLQGRSLLHIISLIGDFECVNNMLMHGFNIYEKDGQGRTCLHHAASTGAMDVVELLLSQGLDPSEQDIDGWTPLVWAIRGGLTRGSFNANILELSEAISYDEHKDDGKLNGWSSALSQEHFTIADALSPRKKAATDVVCDGCESYLSGPRYKCSICPDFDYCFKCFLSFQTTHPHPFDLFRCIDSESGVYRKLPVDLRVEKQAGKAAVEQWKEETNVDFWELWYKLRSNISAELTIPEQHPGKEMSLAHDREDAESVTNRAPGIPECEIPQ